MIFKNHKIEAQWLAIGSYYTRATSYSFYRHELGANTPDTEDKMAGKCEVLVHTTVHTIWVQNLLNNTIFNGVTFMNVFT